MYNFYCFNKDKKIVISNFPSDKIKQKFGNHYEILTSVTELDSVALVLTRLLRSYSSFTVEEFYVKPKRSLTEEHKKKIGLSKIGKPRSLEARQKISHSLKGRSNFAGKKHHPETKQKMAESKIGNVHIRNRAWFHNPTTGEEIMRYSYKDVPSSFMKGRDFYKIEMLRYASISRNRKSEE